MGIVNTIPFRDLMVVSVLGQTTTQTIFNANSPRLKILDAWYINHASADGSADKIKLTDGTNDITDDLVLTTGDKIISRPTTIDDAYNTLEEGDTLKAVFTSAAPADVFILCQLLR